MSEFQDFYVVSTTLEIACVCMFIHTGTRTHAHTHTTHTHIHTHTHINTHTLTHIHTYTHLMARLFMCAQQVNAYVPNSGEQLARLDYRVGEKGWGLCSSDTFMRSMECALHYYAGQLLIRLSAVIRASLPSFPFIFSPFFTVSGVLQKHMN